MSTMLAWAEVEDLAQQEATIHSGLRTFVEVGMALMRIRDRRLYRATHDTFEAYCQERWSLSRTRSYQLIDAASLVDGMSTIGDTPTPANEGQARELSGLPAETAAEVMREARRQAEKVTATVIREVRQQIAPRSAPPEPPPGVEEPAPLTSKQAADPGVAAPPAALRPAGPPAPEPDPGVTQWVESSQAVKDSGYVRAFTADLAKDGRVLLYDVERLATLLDEGQASAVYGLAGELAAFSAALRRQRSSLRLVKGGR